MGSLDDAAKVVISGEYSRRRAYLSNALSNFFVLSIMAPLAIWAFLIKWDALLPTPGSDEALAFCIRIAWASALSSVVMGLLRLYARYIDTEIIRLYPAIYICERTLMPDKICTVVRPAGAKPLSKEHISADFKWKPVRNKDFGGRGHHRIDCIQGFVIVFFGLISIGLAYQYEVDTIWPSIGGPLAGNLIGLLLILGGWLWWLRQELTWPILYSGNQDTEHKGSKQMTLGIAKEHAVETYKSLIQISVAGMKLLALLNGGAAVALLAYLGRISSQGGAVPDMRVPMGCFVVGLVACGLTMLLSYVTQLRVYNEDMGRSKNSFVSRHVFWLYFAFFMAFLSLAAFALGSLLAVVRFNVACLPTS